MRYEKGIYIVSIDGHEIRFCHPPYHLINSDKDYTYKKKISEGDTVIDGGAFYGSFSIVSSFRVGPNGQVIAFEPDPGTLEILRKNIALNNIKNITIIQKGLWSEETELVFNAGKDLGSTFIVDGGGNDKNVIRIPVTTIDKVLESMPVKGDLFIKMNIEGSEIEAVKGAKKTIQAHKPAFSIRTNHYVDGVYTDKRVEQELNQYNYEVETTDTLHELTTFANPR